MSARAASPRRVLITGGAGFIGSHLANRLVESGHRVRILDALQEQVHGPDARFPDYLHPEVERQQGDVRDRQAVRKALAGATHVYHLAAAVGVGQSMYEIEHYTDTNNRGTAVLLECLLEHPVERLVVASSMSIYGEGAYRRGREVCEPLPRRRDQLREGQWELAEDGTVLEPVPTPETKQATPTSVYALSKFDQEKLCLIFGETYAVPVIALRFFNAYGPYQALSNPYTGVLAIFASRCLNGNPALIFEDGLQRRDFVSVHDVARACQLAMDADAAGEVFNVGSGEPRTILSVAEQMRETFGSSVPDPVVTGKYRAGDIRHCYADITKARRQLGYEPQVRFEDGLQELTDWLARTSTREMARDNFMHAAQELNRRGLTL